MCTPFVRHIPIRNTSKFRFVLNDALMWVCGNVKSWNMLSVGEQLGKKYRYRRK